MRTGALIVYTSADSVFQIAAHEEVVPVAELYRACEVAYRLVGEGLGVGRVIARPFVGAPGAFTRTANRRDYALPPSGETLLDRAEGGGAARSSRSGRSRICLPAAASRARFTRPATTRAWIRSSQQMRDGRPRADLREPRGLRHAVRPPQRRRRATRATSSASTAGWPTCCRSCATTDLLVVTADHGNDPTTPSTDHSREYVPLLVDRARCGAASTSARGATFADLGQTLAEIFGVAPLAHGTSFLERDRSRVTHLANSSKRASARSWRRRRPRAPTRAAACARSAKTTSGRRFSAIAIASSTARRSGG